MANPKDKMHDGYQQEKSQGHPWFTCEHEWKWPLGSMYEHEVYCCKCGVTGEAMGKPFADPYTPREIEDGVFWPAT